MANHSSKQWEWLGEKFEVLPGQFITSIDSIKSKAGKNISSQNVRTSLKRFEKLGFLTNKSTKTGRLITVVNWAFYQDENSDLTKQVTKTSQRANKDLTPNKNDKNEKKKDSSAKGDVNPNFPYAKFIEWFNEQTGKKFKNTRANQEIISARFNEGYTKEDFALITRYKVSEWKDDPEWNKYLRLGTLFIPKHIDNYLNEARSYQKQHQQNNVSKATDTDDLKKQAADNLRKVEEAYRKEHPELDE